MTETFSGADNGNKPETTPVATLSDTPNTGELEKLTKRLNDSQEFIATLKTEREADRAKVQNLEELVKKLQAQGDILDAINKPQDAPRNDVDIAETLRKMGVVTAADLEALERKKIEAANFKFVSDAAKAVHGDKVDEYIKTKCTELGVSFDWAVSQAKTAPAAFIKMFDLKISKKPTETPIPSSVNTAAFTDVSTEQPKKISLFGASSKELVELWKQAQAAVQVQNQN